MRGDERVPLTPRQFDLLHVLVSRPGQVISKNVLISEAWRDVSVTDNNLVQQIRQLRQLNPGDFNRYIQTESRDGYRFVEKVTRVAARHTDAEVDALLAPHRAWFDGRAALETLELAEIARARVTLEHLLIDHRGEASVHVALANACALQFEATRADSVPDSGALRSALEHAREACCLNPASAEAMATLGFVLERTGDRANALAALRRAVTLEPGNWRHHLRLSAASWGEERLRAAQRTQTLLDSPIAHLLAATVYVARDALAEAERELDRGLALMSADSSSAPARFPAVALHYLKGLLCLARGKDDEALAAFDRELALEARGHLYARECCANTWAAIGACHLRRGGQADARSAFEQTIARVPHHPMAHAGLALLGKKDKQHDGRDAAPGSVDVAVARAVLLAAGGDAPGAAKLVAAALASAPPGNAGWLVPIEPLLGVADAPAAWTPVLSALKTRSA